MLSASHRPQISTLCSVPDVSAFRAFPSPGRTAPNAVTELQDTDIAAAWLLKAQLEACPSPGGNQGVEHHSPPHADNAEPRASGQLAANGTVSPSTPPTDLNSSESSTSPDISSPSLLNPSIQKKRKRSSEMRDGGEKASDHSRPRRNRINYTRQQLQAMETVFAQTQYPDIIIMEDLAMRLSIPVEKLATWFQNRRSKFRKESKNGHINWMRSQLYTDRSTEVQTTSDGHVLSPPNVSVTPDLSGANFRFSPYSYSNRGMYLDNMVAPYTSPAPSRGQSAGAFAQLPTTLSYPSQLHHSAPYSYNDLATAAACNAAMTSLANYKTTAQTSSPPDYNNPVMASSTGFEGSSTSSPPSVAYSVNQSNYSDSPPDAFHGKSSTADTSVTDSRYYSACYYQRGLPSSGTQRNSFGVYAQY